jgi:ABC-type uncharacterized transport system substrate-binding protein
MKRRDFILLTAAALSLPPGAMGQQATKVARIGFLGLAPESNFTNRVDALRAGVGASAFTWPPEASQQSAIPVVGLLATGMSDAYENIVGAFREGLKQTGYIEGQNVTIEYRWANNEVERLPGLASELVYRQVAVIFTIGPPAALAAKAATSTIPVVAGFGV